MPVVPWPRQKTKHARRTNTETKDPFIIPSPRDADTQSAFGDRGRDCVDLRNEDDRDPEMIP